MNRTYLVVFEKVAEDNWGGFAPDVPGTGGMGDTLESARTSLLEGMQYILEDFAERGISAPEAATGSVDFSEFDPERTDLQYVVEWIAVEVPELATHTHENARQAA